MSFILRYVNPFVLKRQSHHLAIAYYIHALGLYMNTMCTKIKEFQAFSQFPLLSCIFLCIVYCISPGKTVLERNCKDFIILIKKWKLILYPNLLLITKQKSARLRPRSTLLRNQSYRSSNILVHEPHLWRPTIQNKLLI